MYCVAGQSGSQSMLCVPVRLVQSTVSSARDCVSPVRDCVSPVRGCLSPDRGCISPDRGCDNPVRGDVGVSPVPVLSVMEQHRTISTQQPNYPPIGRRQMTRSGVSKGTAWWAHPTSGRSHVVQLSCRVGVPVIVSPQLIVSQSLESFVSAFP